MHKNKTFFVAKSHHKQNQKTIDKPGENICNIYDRQMANIANILKGY